MKTTRNERVAPCSTDRAEQFRCANQWHSLSYLEIAHDNRDFCAGDDENDEDNEKKAENVVILVKPNGGKDEEKLDEHGAKWQNTANKYREKGCRVPGLT